MIDLSLHSYLGLNQNKQLKLTTCKVINEFGCGIFKGITTYHKKTEAILKDIYQYPTCYTLSGGKIRYILDILFIINYFYVLDENNNVLYETETGLHNSLKME